MADLADPYTYDFGYDGGDPFPAPVDIPAGSIFRSDPYGNTESPTQSPTTAGRADGSWVGFTQALPQIAKDIVTVAGAGFGLSMAKENFATQREIAKAQGQAAIAAAQGSINTEKYRAQVAANQAATAARYPNGVPFGTSRQDQIMILIGVAGLVLAVMQLSKKR